MTDLVTNIICAIVLACYNESQYIERCLISCLNQSGNDLEIQIYVADDGSLDETPTLIKGLTEQYPQIKPLYLTHAERGRARHAALQQALSAGFDYLLLIDCDMVLVDNIITECIAFSVKNDLGALVIPEWSFSDYSNFWTRVKVFERNTIYHSGKNWAEYSIEGARFWTHKAYEQSMGFNPDQIAFEDIQPTLRYHKHGGSIGRITQTHLLHDEKYVTFQSLIKKKAYYFSHIPNTVEIEKLSLRTLIIRWYFFRPLMYRRKNLLRYLQSPLLTLGMIILYISLTFIAMWETIIYKK